MNGKSREAGYAVLVAAAELMLSLKPAYAAQTTGPDPQVLRSLRELRAQMREMQRRIDFLTRESEKRAPAREEQMQAAKPGRGRQSVLTAEAQAEIHREVQQAVNRMTLVQSKSWSGENGGWYLQGSPALPIPRFVSNDDSSYVQIIGRIQLDGTYRKTPVEGPSYRDAGGSANIGLYRVRLGVQGQYDNNYIYKFQYDFRSAGLLGVDDAYFGYHGDIGSVYHVILGGNQTVPFGNHEPSTTTTFMDDSLPYKIFQPSKEIGISDKASQKHWLLWYGLFTGQNPGGTSKPYLGTQTFSADGDAVINFINRPGKLFRVGNASSYNSYNSGGAGYAVFPDIQSYGVNLLATPTLAAVKHDLIYSSNITLQYDSLAARADYYVVTDWRNNASNLRTALPSSTASFSGYDFEADYFLTGEIRPYSTEEGNFVGVAPLHPFPDGIGAFQVAVQYDGANLNDNRAGVRGGYETDLDFAINWLATAFVRVDLDVIKVFPVEGGPYNGHGPLFGAMRFQILF